MKKSMFTTMPEWANHAVTLPLATVDNDSKDTAGSLNHEQVAACENLLGRNLISSSAGTGKTSVLIARMRYIKAQYPSSTILMVSFTKKAVLELQQRIGYAEGVTICTFHSLAYRILRSSGKDFSLQTNESGLLTPFVENTNTTVEAVRHSLHGAKANEETIEIQHSYLEFLQENHLVTFDTMQLMALNLLKEDDNLKNLWQSKFELILVDEYMDSDAVQVALTELLSEATGNLTVVGDKKQQIYSFRDAVPNVMNDFAKTSSVFELNINYRSNPAILGLANRVMNTNRPLVAAINEEPIYPFYYTAQDSTDEAKTVTDEIMRLHKNGMPYKDMVVIYRSSRAATAIYQELLRRKIPVVSKSNLQTKYNQRPYSFVVKLFRYMVNTQSKQAFKDIMPILYLKQERFKDIEAIVKDKGCSYTEAARSLELPSFTKRYLDDLSSAIDTVANLSPSMALETLCRHGFKKYVGFRYIHAIDSLIIELKEFSTITAFLANVDKKCEEIAVARKLASKSSDYIQLMTIHATKGMEFPVVFLIGANDGCIPSSRSENIDEEKRLLYVAITRAKEQLFISYPRISDNSSYYNKPSRFLQEAYSV